MRKGGEMQNYNCDGNHCKEINDEVRYLKMSNNSGLILCRSCFGYEIKWRKLRNKELEKQNRFDLPVWDRLEIYE